jgi:ABC-type spermidine/putrescine transport system permease subunit II
VAARSERTARRALEGVTVGYFVWSLIPIVYVCVFSFDSSAVATRWEGVTLRWWAPWSGSSIFRDHDISVAVQHTLLLAVVSAAIALILGTSFAIGIRYLSRQAGFAIYALVVLAIALPPVAFANALWISFIVPLRYVPFGEFGWFGTKAQVAGLATYELPFVVLIVGARLALISFDQEEMATDLGAPPASVLGRVLLPQLWPAIGAAALVALTLSTGEFVITDALRSTDATRSLASSFFAGDPSPKNYALATAVVIAGIAASVLVYVTLRLGAVSTSRRAAT